MTKKVFVSGCYDLLHSGHVEFFRQAAEYGDLYVGIGSDETILHYKGHKTLYPEQERLFMVSAVRWVDEVVTYRDVDEDIRHIDFDVFAKGPDQNHPGFQRAVAWCRENGKEVVVIPRTEGISSTFLKHYSKDR